MVAWDHVIIIGLYFTAMIVIAIYGGRISRDIKDYFMGGGRLGSWVGAFTYQATNVSASALLGAIGLVWFAGPAPEIWITIAFTIGIGLSFKYVLPKVRSISEDVNAVTIPELFESRFDNSSSVRMVSTLLIIIFLIPLLVGQYVGIGLMFEMILGIPFNWALIIVGTIITVKVAYGGFMGVALTDFVQGWFILALAIIMPIIMIGNAGGWSEMISVFHEEAGSAALSFWGTWGPMTTIGVFASILMGCFGIPHTVIRFFSMKKGAEKRALPIAMGFYILLLPLMFFAGMAARIIFPGLAANPDLALPMAAVELLPSVISSLLLAAILAGLMSTIDSIVIVGSSSFTRDIYKGSINPDASDKKQTRIGRLLTIVVGIVAMIYAMTEPGLIIELMAMSWGLFGVTYSLVLLGGLFWKRMNKEGALTALIFGGAVYIFGMQVWAPFGLHPVLFSLMVTLPAMIIVTKLTPKSSEESISKFFKG